MVSILCRFLFLFHANGAISSFYVLEFEMPGTQVLHRSEPVYFSYKDIHRYDVNFQFTTTSELFPEIPEVLECIHRST